MDVRLVWRESSSRRGSSDGGEEGVGAVEGSVGEDEEEEGEGDGELIRLEP